MTTTEKSKLVKPWLQLQKIPEFFCSLLTSKKEDIRTEYKKKKRSKNDTWIKTLASFIGERKKFKWSNSFDDLADDKVDKDYNILLWLADDDFEKHFF